MCSSKPKIPDNKTPPAPPAPEAAPDSIQIGDRSRYNYLRSRGLAIPKRPDLSGLGNQQMGDVVNRLFIGPASSTPSTVDPSIPVAAPTSRPKPTGGNPVYGHR